MLKHLITYFFLFFLSFHSKSQDTSVLDRVNGVFESARTIRSMSYEFVRSERINGKLSQSTSWIKMTKNPQRIYLRESYPNDGLEVLYPHPDDETKALVNPNGFPYFNLKLDPKGELMMRDQHHGLLEVGYDLIISIMEYLTYKYKVQIEDYIQYHGLTIIDGHTCGLIVMENPSFRYINYPISRGETVASIAKKHRLSQQMIRDLNKNVYLDDLKEGQFIQLPTDYSSMMRLYVDVERKIPLRIDVYDDVGLFEKYEFKNVMINPLFEEDEFLDTYDGYNFN